MEKLIESLEKLAATMGQTVEVLWPHAVRGVAIEGVVWIVVWAVPLIICRIIAHNLRDDEWDWDAPSRKNITFIVSMVLLFIEVLVVGTNLPQVLEPVGYSAWEMISRLK